MILITGVTGSLGKATIDFLLKKIPASEIVALARNVDKAADLKEKGIEVRKGDYDDYNSLLEAFSGVEKLLLVSATEIDRRRAQHISAINAAKEAGVKHVIYTSVEMKDSKNSALEEVAYSHTETAKYLKNSGLTYTLLNNALYADVLPRFLGDNVLETGVVFPAGQGKVPFATRMDMAEVAANVLAGTGHENKEYPITNSTYYSFADVAGILSDLSGKNVNYIDMPKEEYASQLAGAGVPEMYINVLTSFGEAIKNGEFVTGRSVTEELLGRKPTNLKEYLQSVYFPNNA